MENPVPVVASLEQHQAESTAQLPVDAPVNAAAPGHTTSGYAANAPIEPTTEVVTTVPVAKKESFLQHIEDFFKKAGKDVEEVVVQLPKVLADSPQVKAAVQLTITDAVVAFKDLEAEVADTETGNFVGTVTLAPATIAAIKQVIVDAKSGDQLVIADLKALGITI